MRVISKAVCLVALVALSNLGKTQAATEDHDIAVTMVAMGRMCAEQEPGMNYSLQNIFSLPDIAANADLKKEILAVDTNPAFQDEIKAVQVQAAGDPSAAKHFCPSYAPKASK